MSGYFRCSLWYFTNETVQTILVALLSLEVGGYKSERSSSPWTCDRRLRLITLSAPGMLLFSDMRFNIGFTPQDRSDCVFELALSASRKVASQLATLLLILDVCGGNPYHTGLR